MIITLYKSAVVKKSWGEKLLPTVVFDSSGRKIEEAYVKIGEIISFIKIFGKTFESAEEVKAYMYEFTLPNAIKNLVTEENFSVNCSTKILLFRFYNPNTGGENYSAYKKFLSVFEVFSEQADFKILSSAFNRFYPTYS